MSDARRIYRPKRPSCEWWEILFSVVIALVLLYTVLEYIVPANAQVMNNMGPPFPVLDPRDTTPNPYLHEG